jgi:CheY-like chemotaxis protein
VRAERAALVVSDHNMPGMTGLELLAHVRRQDLAAAVVLYTSDPDARQRAVALGLGVLDKGEPPERLRELVASHVAPGAAPPP